PAGVGPGPVVAGKGGWISLDGSTWEQLGIDYPTLDYNWNLWAGLELTSEPPETPGKPDGPNEGITYKEYTFTANTTDPEGDQIYYRFDWGDGTDSGWVGPYNSGDTGTASKTWEDAGDFQVKVKAKDVYNKESGWSPGHTITIAPGPKLEIGVARGGLFKVSVPIENIGGGEATNVQWKIKLKGGAFIGKETSGTETIPGYGEKTVKSKTIIGFGATTVTVTAEIPDGVSDTRQQNGFILLFFINVKPGG
ncbi:MAG: hypothetical protein JSW60_03125, partial [Thermoplasmatales archaeon]